MKSKLPKIYYRIAEIITGECMEICDIYVPGRFILRYERPSGETSIDVNKKRIADMFYGLVRKRKQFDRLPVSEETYKGSDLEKAIEFFSEGITTKDRRIIDEHLSVILESIGMLEE